MNFSVAPISPAAEIEHAAGDVDWQAAWSQSRARSTTSDTGTRGNSPA